MCGLFWQTAKVTLRPWILGCRAVTNSQTNLAKNGECSARSFPGLAGPLEKTGMEHT